MKRYRVREEMNGVTEPPGKVWFWELEAGVIHADRCIQCGTCVAVCPSNSIGIDFDTNLPELVKMCTGCSLCWDFCPRGGLRYEALWPPSTAVEGEEADVVPAQVRSDSSDTYWKITGAPRPTGWARWSRASPCAPRPRWTTSRTAVRSARCSSGCWRPGRSTARWSPSPAAIRTSSGRASPPSPPRPSRSRPPRAASTTRPWPWPSWTSPPTSWAQPRIAVVGTPCEVQGLRAMQARRWPTGAHRVDAVVLSIALMCTKNFDYEALTLKELRDKRGVDLDRVSKMDVIRGRMIVEYRDGELAVDEPVKDFHGAALKGCDECADFLGRSADISVGSVGSMDGWTSVLIRTERGRLAFQAARAKLDVRGLDDPAALLRLDALDKKIAGRTLQRKLDPDAPLFIDFEEHVRTYDGTDRRPVFIRH